MYKRYYDKYCYRAYVVFDFRQRDLANVQIMVVL